MPPLPFLNYYKALPKKPKAPPKPKAKKAPKLTTVPESPFTGKRKDSAGRNRCYQEGKLVACAKIGQTAQATAKPKKETKPKKPKVPKTSLKPKKEAKPKIPPKAKATAEEALDVINKVKSQKEVTPDNLNSVVDTLRGMTVPELKKLAKLAGVTEPPAKKDEILAKLKDNIESAGNLQKEKIELTDKDNSVSDNDAEEPISNVLQGVKSREAFVESLAQLPIKKRVAAVQKWMEDISEPVGDIKIHGMTDAEPMKGFEIDGVEIQCAVIDSNAAYLVLDALTTTMPEALWKATSRIAISTQRNSTDAQWEKQFNMPGFKSAATGGDGEICVYNGADGLLEKLVPHENGHNLAIKIWGITTPDSGSAYGRAQEEEPPVTVYGSKSAAEDFAEACYLYVLRKEDLKQKFPKKFAALEDIFSGKVKIYETRGEAADSGMDFGDIGFDDTDF